MVSITECSRRMLIAAYLAFPLTSRHKLIIRKLRIVEKVL